VGAGERAWRWCARNPVLAALIAAVTVALLAGTAISTYFALTATAEKQRADAIAGKERDSADRLRRDSYAAHMRLVQRACEDGDLRTALRLLKEREPQPGEKDERGFEWHYLTRLCHKDSTTLTLKEAGQVRAIAFSPDGRRLATVRESRRNNPDGKSFQITACELDIWDTAGGQKLRTLKPHNYSNHFSPVVFSPDGRKLAWGGWPGDTTKDGRVLPLKLWDVESGQELRALSCLGGPTDIVFSPDGKRLVAATTNVLNIWDAASGQEVGTLVLGHPDDITSVAFSPDGKRLASASKLRDSKSVVLKVFDPDSGQELQTFTGHAEYAAWNVVCSPDGRHLASTHYGDTVRLWDAAAGGKPRVLQGHTDAITNVAFNSDGTRLASMDTPRGRVMIWDVAGSQPLLTLKGPAGVALNGGSLTFSPDGYRLAAAGRDQPVVLWDARPR
jgi:WD40 repeat protein